MKALAYNIRILGGTEKILELVQLCYAIVEWLTREETGQNWQG
jgi:hypothetical protein